MIGYTIEGIRTTPAGNLVYSLVLEDWRRASVMIPRRRATADNIAATIQHALTHLHPPVKPL